jgi:superfamily II DNA or RNA helicase
MGEMRKMNIDIRKREIQSDAVKAWKEADMIGTIELATGMGKTFISLDCMSELPKGSKVLFLAETTQREVDLMEDIRRYRELFGVDILSHVDLEFACYQSACRWKGRKFDLVCADEIHDSISEVYMQFYRNNRYDRLLGLSATVRSSRTYVIDGVEMSKEVILDDIAPVCFTYDVGDGQRDGTGRRLDFHVIYHHLDRETRNIPGGNDRARFMSTEEKTYRYYDDLFWQGVYSKKDFLVKRAMSSRAKLLYSLPSKVAAVRKLLGIIDGKTVLFSNDLDSLETITPNVVRSPRKGEAKKERDAMNMRIRNDFDLNRIRDIGSFKMLKQGANLKEADNVILISYYSTLLDLVQKIGRLRKNGEKRGNVYILVTVGTQEQKWFDRMTESFPMEQFNVTTYMSMDHFVKEHARACCSK